MDEFTTFPLVSLAAFVDKLALIISVCVYVYAYVYMRICICVSECVCVIYVSENVVYSWCSFSLSTSP